MKKRLFSLVLAMLLVISLLPAASAENDEKLIIWAATTDVQVIMDDYFAKAYPEVEYEVVLYSGGDYTQKLDAVLASSTSERPDIISAEVS